jgi:hypothetical protein
MGKTEVWEVSELAIIQGPAVVLLSTIVILGTVSLVSVSKSKRKPLVLPETTQEDRLLATVDDRVEQAARILVAALSDRHPVTYATMRERLMGSSRGMIQGGYIHVPGEVADALVMISRPVPELALYDRTVELLMKLRALVGSRNFLYVCGQLAVTLRDERHHELADALAGGRLEWTDFLFHLRSTPMAEFIGAVPDPYRAASAKRGFPLAGASFPSR